MNVAAHAWKISRIDNASYLQNSTPFRYSLATMQVGMHFVLIGHFKALGSQQCEKTYGDV